MNVTAIIRELRLELERIDGLILALEALRSGRRQGRPPKALQALRSGANMGSSPAEQQAAAVREEEARSAGRGKKRRAKTTPKKARSKPKS